MSAVESPALERYRGARADIAEIERDRIKGQFISVATVSEMVSMFAPLIRRAGEKLRAEFGNDAGDILNNAIQEWEAQAERMVEQLKAGAAGHG